MGRGEVNDWQWVSMGHTGGSRNVSHRAEGQVTVNQRTLQSDNKRVNLAWVGFHIPAPRCTSKTPFTFPAIILSLFQPRQPRVHLIKTLKMPSFCFLAHFVGTFCSANTWRWMKPQATNGGMRQIRMGADGHPLRKGKWPQNWHIWGNHHPCGAQTTNVWTRSLCSPVLAGYRCELGVVETVLTVMRCVAYDTCRIAQSLSF